MAFTNLRIYELSNSAGNGKSSNKFVDS